IRAIEALGSIDSPAVVDTLERLLHPRHPELVQLAALRAPREQAGPEVARVVAGAWRGLTPAVRTQAAAVALRRRDRLGPLVEAIRAGQVPAAAFDPAQRARLLGSSDPTVAAAAKAIFGPASRTLDPKLFEKSRGALDLRGGPARGAATFRKLSITCNKAG